MKLTKFHSFAMAGVLCISGFASAGNVISNAEVITENDATESSSIVGIWNDTKDPKYYYEFKANGEIIIYKFMPKTVRKYFGTYKIVGNFKLVFTVDNESENSMEFHIDGNTGQAEMAVHMLN